MKHLLNGAFFLAVVTVTGMFSGCANYEVNTNRGNIPGYYIRTEMQQADRAVEAARQAGKDKLCPAEFKAAEDAKNHAYDVFRACFTEEGAALAKKATEQANALCPPQPAKAEPVPVVKAPTCDIMILPDSVTKGQTAKLAWTSENATTCDIQPGIGSVPLHGSMVVTPSASTTYTLVCSGAGSSAARSTASVAVAAVPQAPVAACAPILINIQFDTNKSDIKPQYHGELKKVADFLTKNPKAKGVIEGHTDSVGDMASNMKLSQRRADSVRTYIIKNFGIAPERFSAKGFGPTRPIADNKTAEGKQKNRRIEANFTCNGK